MTQWKNSAEYLYGAAAWEPASPVLLQESAVLIAPRTHRLREAAVAAPVAGAVWRVKLIAADVQGSSGYYPSEVLRRDGPAVFRSGTHVYMNHPGRFESEDLPERSVRDLAGVLTESASYAEGPDGPGLYAFVEIFPDYADEVAAKARHIGMSIRASGLKEFDAATGLDMITRLLQADSVDIVTRPGAGGRLIEQITPGAWRPTT